MASASIRNDDKRKQQQRVRWRIAWELGERMWPTAVHMRRGATFWAPALDVQTGSNSARGAVFWTMFGRSLSHLPRSPPKRTHSIHWRQCLFLCGLVLQHVMAHMPLVPGVWTPILVSEAPPSTGTY
jgi:hypothetical protein